MTTTPADIQTFEIDMPEDVYAVARCPVCTGDVIAVQEDPDSDVVTLTRTHDLDCAELARIRAARTEL